MKGNTVDKVIPLTNETLEGLQQAISELKGEWEPVSFYETRDPNPHGSPLQVAWLRKIPKDAIWDTLIVDLTGSASEEMAIIGGMAKDWKMIAVVSSPLCRRAYFQREASRGCQVSRDQDPKGEKFLEL